MMGVLTFSANWDQVEGKVLVQGDSSMVSNSALRAVAAGNVEHVDKVGPDLVSLGLVASVGSLGAHDLL